MGLCLTSMCLEIARTNILLLQPTITQCNNNNNNTQLHYAMQHI